MNANPEYLLFLEEIKKHEIEEMLLLYRRYLPSDSVLKLSLEFMMNFYEKKYKKRVLSGVLIPVRKLILNNSNNLGMVKIIQGKCEDMGVFQFKCNKKLCRNSITKYCQHGRHFVLDKTKIVDLLWIVHKEFLTRGLPFLLTTNKEENDP